MRGSEWIVDSFNGSNFSYGGSLPVHYNARIGFSGGVGINRMLNSRFSLVAKFLYEKKGSSATTTITYQQGTAYDNIEVTIDQHYLSLPVTMRYLFASLGKKIKLEGEVGTFFGYLVKATETQPAFTPAGFQANTRNAITRYKVADLGLSFGVNGVIPVSQILSFRISLLDNMGLRDIGRDGKTIRTNSLNLSLGINYLL